MINDDQLRLVHTTDYLHAAVYAAFIVKATFDNKPFAFNWS